MRLIYAVLTCTWLFSVNAVQIAAQSESFYKASPTQLVLSGKLLKFDKDELELEVVLENKSGHDVYVATDPQRVSGEKGYYFSLDKADNSFIKVTSIVFPIPPFFLFADDTSVVLKWLKPGEKYMDTVSIGFPTKETLPPYSISSRKTITQQTLKKVEISIGYFDKEDVDGLLTHRVKGHSKIRAGKNKGKMLFETQELIIADANIVDVDR